MSKSTRVFGFCFCSCDLEFSCAYSVFYSYFYSFSTAALLINLFFLYFLWTRNLLCMAYQVHFLKGKLFYKDYCPNSFEMSLLNCVPCVSYVPTCQKHANFSFFCANIPINIPTCQFFNLACQRAKRGANFSISPAKRHTNFSFIFHFSIFEFFNYA